MGSTILLLEHDEADIFLFRRSLAAIGFPGCVRVVGSVAEARDYLRGSGQYADRRYYPMPDLIVSDLKVPGRTGAEFLQWLQDQTEFREIPFVMYSGSATGSEAKDVLAGGARAFVRKELDFKDAVARVREILQHMPKDDPGPSRA